MADILQDLKQLDEALRALEAPDRKIDDRLWRWVNDAKVNPRAPGWQYDLEFAPHFTESLDAARSFIPRLETCDGVLPMDFVLEHINGGITIGARVGEQDPDKVVFGENDAIALTRAALRAHMMLILDGLTSLPLVAMQFPQAAGAKAAS